MPMKNGMNSSMVIGHPRDAATASKYSLWFPPRAINFESTRSRRCSNVNPWFWLSYRIPKSTSISSSNSVVVAASFSTKINSSARVSTRANSCLNWMIGVYPFTCAIMVLALNWVFLSASRLGLFTFSAVIVALWAFLFAITPPNKGTANRKGISYDNKSNCNPDVNFDFIRLYLGRVGAVQRPARPERRGKWNIGLLITM